MPSGLAAVSVDLARFGITGLTDAGHSNGVADLDRFRSTAARTRLGRTNEDIRRANDRFRVQLTLTSANHQWLRAQVQSRPGVTTADLINGLITRARESAL